MNRKDLLSITKDTAFSLGLCLLIPLFAMGNSSSWAISESCGDYGGGICEQTAAIEFNKEVWNSKLSSWEGDLDAEEYTFRVGDLVSYRIAFRNTGDINLAAVTIKDRLPEGLDFVSGPGTYNAASRTLTYHFGELHKDTGWYHVTFDAKVRESEVFSDGRDVCFKNEAWVEVDGTERGRSDALICAKEPGEVLAATVLPVSGATSGLAMMLTSVVLIAAGIILRKIAVNLA